MKNKIIIASLIGIFVSMSFSVTFPISVSAIANPAAVYCAEFGYELEIRTKPDGGQYGVCIFPDGSECNQWQYYCKCEPEGIGCWQNDFDCDFPCKGLSCKKAGESVLVSKCCEGLIVLNNYIPGPNGTCEKIIGMKVGAPGICSDCGNGTCENWENICNCPIDCPGTIEKKIEEKTPIKVESKEQITDQWCDAMNACPKELECFSFSGIGLRCAEPNPCSYYGCPENTKCSILKSYPGQVKCFCVGPECPAASGDEDTVSYDLLTQTVVHTIEPDEQTVSHDISLWKTAENKGILETAFASVEYSNKLIVEESQLLMETSVGKKSINIMPEHAIAVSETPNTESIQTIELREESTKPIYSVKGTKKARLLFIFPVTLNIETKIDAENGEVISVKKPWWSFLAW